METYHDPYHSDPNRQADAGPRPGSFTKMIEASRNQQARLALEYTLRALARRLGADPETTETLVAESRRSFVMVNSLPSACDPSGQPLYGPDGLPLSPEAWLHQRLNLA